MNQQLTSMTQKIKLFA